MFHGTWVKVTWCLRNWAVWPAYPRASSIWPYPTQPPRGSRASGLAAWLHTGPRRRAGHPSPASTASG